MVGLSALKNVGAWHAAIHVLTQLDGQRFQVDVPLVNCVTLTCADLGVGRALGRGGPPPEHAFIKGWPPAKAVGMSWRSVYSPTTWGWHFGATSPQPRSCGLHTSAHFRACKASLQPDSNTFRSSNALGEALLFQTLAWVLQSPAFSAPEAPQLFAARTGSGLTPCSGWTVPRKQLCLSPDAWTSRPEE